MKVLKIDVTEEITSIIDKMEWNFANPGMTEKYSAGDDNSIQLKIQGEILTLDISFDIVRYFHLVYSETQFAPAEYSYSIKIKEPIELKLWESDGKESDIEVVFDEDKIDKYLTNNN